MDIRTPRPRDERERHRAALRQEPTEAASARRSLDLEEPRPDEEWNPKWS